MIEEPEVKHKFFFVTPDLPFVNIPVMEIHELRSLTALAESGSLASVAQRLHLSPAAIHKHFRALETELGVPLYEGSDAT
jgi:hypothetical protein